MSGSCRLDVSGLDCACCAEKIVRAVKKKMPEVKSAEIDVAGGVMLVSFESADPPATLATRISAIASKIEPDVEISLPGAAADRPARPEWLVPLGRILAAIAMLVCAMAIHLPQYAMIGLSVAAYLLVGYDVLIKMVRNVMRGEIFDENFLMSVATIGAICIGEYPEAAGVMIFYQTGSLIEGIAVGRSRKTIEALAAIRPDTALVLGDDGRVTEVSPEAVAVGSLIEVRPGGKVPLDGVVELGSSSVDTAALTGEPQPRDVAGGDEVLAGFVNLDGRLTVRTTREYGSSVAARIIDMVRGAAAKKAKTEKFITKFAKIYTPTMVGAAAVIAIVPTIVTGTPFSDWLYRALVFLVVSCPCALVISVPLGYFGGIGGAARGGVLLKGGASLEALAKVDTVVFDKTGTLTEGRFRVTGVFPADGVSESYLTARAAAAEAGSTHPVARSIVDGFGASSIIPDSYREIAGMGVIAKYGSKTIAAGNRRLMEREGVILPDGATGTIFVSESGRYLGGIRVADTLRSDSAAAISGLRGLGVTRIDVLTGDTEQSAAESLAGLDIDSIHAGLLPDGKLNALEKVLDNARGAVAFVGDGINDAPVLARADIGVAMGGAGSDAAVEAADAVIMTDSPSKLCGAIKTARKTRNIIIQNIALALGLKAIVLVLGAMGMATMWEATFADVGVALLCILNAFRAMRLR